MHPSPTKMAPTVASAAWWDVRLVGFAARSELEAMHGRLDAMVTQLAAGPVPLDEALGRVLAAPATAAADLPPRARARVDGYALDAAATFGAGPYNLLELRLDAAGPATRIAAGEPMPPGTDAVLPFAAASTGDSTLEIAEPVAPGDGIEPAGSVWRQGGMVVPAGRRLAPLDLARAAEAGLGELTVVPAPQVRVLVRGAKGPTTAADPLLPLLRGLLARDGGVADGAVVAEGLGDALQRAAAADLVLVAGRSGTGADDDSMAALAAVGRDDAHGLAIAPGGTAGLGRLGNVPVILLPGEPLACLAAYELLAGRGGAAPGRPAARAAASPPPAAAHHQDRGTDRHDRALAGAARRRGHRTAGAARSGDTRDDRGRDRLCLGAGRLGRLSGRQRTRGATCSITAMTDQPHLSPDLRAALSMAARQQQFLEVVGLDEARARLRRHLDLRPGAGERVPLGAALQRVLAEDVLAPVDVPGFDRASMDGFALRAADSTGAAEAAPCRLRVNAEIVTPGLQPALAVGPGTATVIATGGMLPRGADAVVMVEQTELVGPDADGVFQLELRRPVAPGAAIAAAGGDIARGETVLRAGAC